MLPRSNPTTPPAKRQPWIKRCHGHLYLCSTVHITSPTFTITATLGSHFPPKLSGIQLTSPMAASALSNAFLSPVSPPSNSNSCHPKISLLKFPNPRSHPLPTQLRITTTNTRPLATFCSSDAAAHASKDDDTPIELSMHSLLPMISCCASLPISYFSHYHVFWVLLLQGIPHSQPSWISTRFVRFCPTGMYLYIFGTLAFLGFLELFCSRFVVAFCCSFIFNFSLICFLGWGVWFRFPFLLVDRVIEYNPGVSAVAIKNVTINDNFFPGHFPERPIMPGVLMVEVSKHSASRYIFISPIPYYIANVCKCLMIYVYDSYAL